MLTSTYFQITKVTISQLVKSLQNIINLQIKFEIIRYGIVSCIRIFSVRQDHLPDDWKYETLSCKS